MAQQETPAFKQLREQLREMFQLDRGDLDFGLYRIMNQKRDEVTRFLDEQLLPQVRSVLEDYQPAGGASAQDELNKLIASLTDAGVDPETSPKVQELRAKLSQSVDLDKLEQEIYSDLHNFFKRYYSDGDFMSMRRYKEGVYALPYEGEEVKLHWANHDQYYIKTSEDLKNYSFKTTGNKRVRFEVVDGGTETNNNKAAEGKERRFILHAAAPVQSSGDDLTIRFEYRPSADKKKKQEQLNQEAVQQLVNLAEISAFGLTEAAPTEKNKDRTLLEKHLNDFTAKNSFDYFIHKDLGKFLTRELDFYIKNEIMHLDDIENETAPKVESYLAKVKAMRKVAGKIIQFLAHLEDFQKKLWLKKKFVLETHYCITLDHIIGSDVEDALLPIIAANDAQREEWVKLFAIDDLNGYAAPLTTDFLKSNDKLLVDTKFFDVKFKYTLLSIFDDIDAQTDGVMINSENFQALNLLQERYKEKVKCIYIDPPYNTGDDGFAYKDSYQHSSWCSLMKDRLEVARKTLREDGWLFVSISENEYHRLISLINQVFGDNILTTITVKMSHLSGMKMTHADKKPPKIKEYLVMAAYDKGRTNWNPQYEKASWFEVFDRYSGYLEVDQAAPADHSKWQRKNLKQAAKDFGIDINDLASFEDFCLENASKIFRTAVNDSDQIKNTPKDSVFRKVETSTGLIKYAYNKEEVLFASSYLQDVDGKKMPARVISDIWTDIGINNLHNEGGVQFPNGKKPVKLIDRVIKMASSEPSLVLDFFAGSGSTAHAAMLNNRKYICIEQGEYFDQKLKTRTLRSSYSDSWLLDKPTSRNGLSQIIKLVGVEQYEDALDNLGLSKSETQSALLASNPSLNEQYMLGYMLDVESRGSQSLLNIDDFADPFAYGLRITRNDDTQVVNVDLIETFNYMLGLTVRTVDRDKSGIVTITGKNSLGENCLIIWRNTGDVDSNALDDWFKKRYSVKDFEFDAIYVNGDNNIENMKMADQTWKVRLIELEFKRLMFDVQDV